MASFSIWVSSLRWGYTVRIGDKDSHDLSGLDADAAHDMAHDARAGVFF